MDKKVHYRDYMKALRELREQLKGGDEEIYQLSRDDEPIELGINWHAIGTASAERAMRVAARIIVAAEAVDKFPYNGYIQDFSDPAAPDGGDIKSPIPVVKEKPVGTDENAFIAKLLIPKKQLDTIDGYLDAKTGYEFQGKGRIICNGVRFPDGAVVDIKCCGRDNDASWTESVLFKKESAVGHLVDIYHTDAKDSYRGEYELHDDAVGVIYRIIVENGGDIDEAQLIPLQNAARYEASGGWAVNGCNVPKKRCGMHSTAPTSALTQRMMIPGRIQAGTCLWTFTAALRRKSFAKWRRWMPTRCQRISGLLKSKERH